MSKHTVRQRIEAPDLTFEVDNTIDECVVAIHAGTHLIDITIDVENQKLDWTVRGVVEARGNCLFERHEEVDRT